MESSSHYTNVPASGYLAVTSWDRSSGDYRLLGDRKIVNISLVTPEGIGIIVLWIAGVSVVNWNRDHCAWRKARKHGHSAQILAARMLLSRLPVIFVAGVLSVALTKKVIWILFRGMWL